MTQFSAKCAFVVAVAVTLSECTALEEKKHVELNKVQEEPCLTYAVANSTLSAQQTLNLLAQLPDGTWI